jgi:hypothetical protein
VTEPVDFSQRLAIKQTAVTKQHYDRLVSVLDMVDYPDTEEAGVALLTLAIRLLYENGMSKVEFLRWANALYDGVLLSDGGNKEGA